MRRTPDQLVAPIHWLAAAGLATVAHLGVIVPSVGGVDLPYSDDIGVEIDLGVSTTTPPLAANAEAPAPATAAQAASTVAATPHHQGTALRRATPTPSTPVQPARTGPSGVQVASRTAKSTGPGDYFTELQQWLAQFRDYPESARQRGWEGVVELAFVIESDGRVRNARIAQSSGFAILDNAAFEMLDRATPLPALPPALSRQPLSITVPVGYHLHAPGMQ